MVSSSIDTTRLVEAVDTDELVKLTRKLVSIPSVYRPGSGETEARVASFLVDYLKGLGLPGLTVTTDEAAPGRPNIIAILDTGKPGRTILLEGHTDTCTEGDAKDWTYDPFGGEVSGGRIYGRGSCDTKGNLAAAIIAVRALVSSGSLRRGRVVLCIPVDEEGMMIGIKRFIQAGYAKGVDAAIICEPEENQLCVTQKGAMRVVFRVHGKMSHGAMPLSGCNPIPRMASIIAAVGDYERSEKTRLGCHEYLGWPSLTPTIATAPPAGVEPQINVMPGEAFLALDIRTIPGQDHAEIEKTLEGILRRLRATDPDFKADMEVIERRPWTETKMSEPIVKATSEAYRLVAGKEPKYNGVPGATDGTFLNSMLGIPVVTTGAGNRLIPHQKDEYVDIWELEEAAKLFAVAAALYLEEAR